MKKKLENSGRVTQRLNLVIKCLKNEVLGEPLKFSEWESNFIHSMAVKIIDNHDYGLTATQIKKLEEIYRKRQFV